MTQKANKPYNPSALGIATGVTIGSYLADRKNYSPIRGVTTFGAAYATGKAMNHQRTKKAALAGPQTHKNFHQSRMHEGNRL